MSTDFYTVGIIVGTHGIRGELKVLSRTDFPEKRFKPNSELHVRKPMQKPDRTLTVLSARPHKNVWLVAFKGYDDINSVENWRGLELCVAEEDLAPLPKGTYYIHQLIGLKVYTDNEQYLGELTEVLQPGANDVYVVKGPVQKQDILIPAIPDVIMQVLPDEQKMVVRLMPGMLEDEE